MNNVFKKRIPKAVLIIFLVVSVSGILTGCSSIGVSKIKNEVMSLFDDEYVTIVKKGHLQMAPNVTIGEAFADFFGDPKWESFNSTDGQRVVEFTGNCSWKDEPAKCRMQFIVNPDKRTFETGAVSINGDNLNVLETAVIMAKILGNSATEDNASTQVSARKTTLDIGEYISQKDKFDVEIAAVAADINNYLSRHSDFRGSDAQSLIDRAKATLDKVENTQKELKQGQVNSGDEATKEALIKVFDCEAGRIRGLYKGMLDSKNNGDYMSGFRDGTAASYRFDDENAKLNALYKR